MGLSAREKLEKYSDKMMFYVVKLCSLKFIIENSKFPGKKVILVEKILCCEG